MSHTSIRHHHLTIALHWLTVVTILCAVSAVFMREFFEDDEMRLLLLNLHRSFGVLILLLVILRVAARYKYYVVRVGETLPRILRRLAGVTHFVLYLFLFALPITGWLFTSAAGKTVTVFGVANLPSLLQKNRDLAERLGDIHETLAWFFIVLITAHILAALWHHFVRKDDVLTAILPSRKIKK